MLKLGLISVVHMSNKNSYNETMNKAKHTATAAHQNCGAVITPAPVVGLGLAPEPVPVPEPPEPEPDPEPGDVPVAVASLVIR